LSNVKLDALLEKIRSSVTTKREVNQSINAASRVHAKRMSALELFRPFAYQDEFLMCDASEVLVRGGTRSGKSTVVAAAIASYLLVKPLYTSCGIPLHMREEEFQKKEVGEIWVIGKQMNHSSTIYRLLFQAGAFQIVRDPVTGRWRAWQPGTIPGDDQIPAKMRKLAPPFIPASEIAPNGIGWEKKSEKQWNTITLNNGWTIKYFPSNGQPKRGDPVHRIWIDEDIENDDLYPELQSRLSDYKGRIWWTSWPELNCQPLVTLYDRAVDDMADLAAGRIKRCDVVQMAFRGSDNPVIDEDEKRKRSKGWDEQTRRARDDGDFVRESRLTYPEFDKHYHVVDYGPEDPRNDKLTAVLRARNFVPPNDWSVTIILDPGTIRPAILWVATPPPDFWYGQNPYYVPYREITGRYDASQLALRVKEMDPGRVYSKWIIDHKGGDQTAMGDAHRVEDKYSSAFAAMGLKNDLTGTRFVASEHSWIIRSMAFRKTMMPVGEDAPRPQLRIVSHMCPELIRQIGRNMRNVSKDDVQDKQATGQVQDLLSCLEYFAGGRPEYRVPSKPAPEETPGFRAFSGEQSRWDQLVIGRNKTPRNNVVCGVP
jgi:hypothetical protein